MVFIPWSDNLSVGVQEIDQQHQKLISMLNQFYDMVTQDNRKALESLLNSMAEYTLYHFKTEEAYFDRFQYSDSAEHKKRHQEFAAKVADVTARIRSGKMVISMEVTNYLKEWVTNHILREDKKYQACFNANGLH